MKAQQKLDNSEVLTIDLDATRENMRIKYHSSAAFSRMLIANGEDVAPSTVHSLLNGNMRYFSDPASVYQRLLRIFKEHGVLVEQTNLKEAA